MSEGTTTERVSIERLVTRLVQLRKDLGYSQEQVAKKMRMAQGTVSAFETNEKDPRLKQVLRYANAIGVKVHMSIEAPGKDAR